MNRVFACTRGCCLAAVISASRQTPTCALSAACFQQTSKAGEDEEAVDEEEESLVPRR